MDFVHFGILQVGYLLRRAWEAEKTGERRISSVRKNSFEFFAKQLENR
jgi:hypothetical protein